MIPDHETFPGWLTRFKLTAIRDQLDDLIDEAGGNAVAAVWALVDHRQLDGAAIRRLRGTGRRTGDCDDIGTRAADQQALVHAQRPLRSRGGAEAGPRPAYHHHAPRRRRPNLKRLDQRTRRSCSSRLLQLKKCAASRCGSRDRPLMRGSAIDRHGAVLRLPPLSFFGGGNRRADPVFQSSALPR